MDIYLDENLSEHVAEALNLLNKGYFTDVQVFATKNKIGKGAPDEEIIPTLGKIGATLITRDFNIQRSRLQADLCRTCGIGMFFLTLPKHQNKHWDLVKLLINHWEAVVKKISEVRKPFAYRIHTKGKIEKLS